MFKWKEYNYFLGIPHSHTAISTGEGSCEEAYRHSMGKGCDYLIITDHLSRIAKSQKPEELWGSVKSSASGFERRHRNFKALQGFEVSVKDTGHFSLFNIKELPIEMSRKVNIEKLEKLKDMYPDALISLNHPEEKVICSCKRKDIIRRIDFVEVGNGLYPDRYKRTEELYFKLLDRDIHAGVLNGQDNHGADWGDYENITVILSRKKVSHGIMEGLKRKRTYSTESASMKMIFKADSYLMGEDISLSEDDILHLSAAVQDSIHPVKKLQFITNGGVIIKETEASEEDCLSAEVNVKPPDGNTWYTVRAISEDGRHSIASPVFVHKNEKLKMKKEG